MNTEKNTYLLLNSQGAIIKEAQADTLREAISEFRQDFAGLDCIIRELDENDKQIAIHKIKL